MRIGHGYDAHRLGPGRALILAGLTIEHETGLIGHSDGDVVTHAAIDALLGAAGLGDIGSRFPSSDERWRDADSTALLREVVVLLRQAGWAIGNLDVTVVAEAPRLSPHVAAMRACLARALGIDDNRVSIKPKTTDGMGFEGRGEGISATAVVLLESA